MSDLAARRIRLLDSRLANQIAAGEVVERPASVLKELLENSIDAGATHIEVELERAGVKLLRVRDNGQGIHQEDLPLALCRHATSKLISSDELLAIGTLGFRGEALAAIASVSRFSLTSRRADSEHGWQVELHGEPTPAPHPVGTTVEVRDLFHNVPARRKFLRGERTELAHLEEVARRVALSRFDLALSVRHDGRRLLELRPADGQQERLRRIAEVCGTPFARAAKTVAFNAAGMELHGWLLPPDLSRPQGDQQYFFVNGRVVRDRLVMHAVRTAFGEQVAEGRYPAYVLYLELDPAGVDVNVHPTKHEVRFRESRMVHDFILQGVRRALESSDPPPSPTSPPPVEADALAIEESTTPLGMASLSHRQDPSPRHTSPRTNRIAYPTPSRPASGAGADTLYARLFPNRESAPSANEPCLLGRAGSRFLLGLSGETLLVVDRPRALSLLLAHRLEASWQGDGVVSQPLLVPASLPVTEPQAAQLEGGHDPLGRLGFEIQVIATTSVVVRAVPTLLRQVPAAQLLPPLLEWLAREGAPPFAALADQGGEELPEARDPQRLLTALTTLGAAAAGVTRHLDPTALGALFDTP